MLAAGYPPDVKGGGEYSSQLLAEALTDVGHDVFVLCAAEKFSSSHMQGVAVERVRSPNLYWNFDRSRSGAAKLVWHALDNWNPKSERLVRAFLRRVRPDVFITSTVENFGAAAWTAAVAEGVPTVHVLRSYYTMCWRGTAFRNGRNCDGQCSDCRVATVGRRRASALVDGVVGLCQSTLDRHLSLGLFPRAKRFVLPDPVASELPPLLPREPRPPVFGYLGFLTPNKGVETIAQAFRSLPDGSGLPLLVAGTGDPQYVASLQAEFAGLHVQFLGWQDSQHFLRQIDWLIVPSLWVEPFGRIVVEAFAVGVPVLGSASGGIGEMITDGLTGFRFSPGNYAELAKLVEQVSAITPSAYRIVSAGALAAAQLYAGRPIAGRYTTMLEQVSAKHQSEILQAAAE